MVNKYDIIKPSSTAMRPSFEELHGEAPTRRTYNPENITAEQALYLAKKEIKEAIEQGKKLNYDDVFRNLKDKGFDLKDDNKYHYIEKDKTVVKLDAKDLFKEVEKINEKRTDYHNIKNAPIPEEPTKLTAFFNAAKYDREMVRIAEIKAEKASLPDLFKPDFRGFDLSGKLEFPDKEIGSKPTTERSQVHSNLSISSKEMDNIFSSAVDKTLRANSALTRAEARNEVIKNPKILMREIALQKDLKSFTPEVKEAIVQSLRESLQDSFRKDVNQEKSLEQNIQRQNKTKEKDLEL